MSGRTPSFIVVGLVIIMFLLGLFYMSCSSKNNELRLSLEQFEERIRSLTIKDSESEKKIESLNTRKRELEEEKINVQRQMEKKDSEINELTTKLNERQAELQSLKSDKQMLDEQLKEFKSMTDVVAAKNSLIEKLQQQLADQKQSSNNEVSRLNQELDGLRNRPSQNNAAPANDRVNSFQNPNQRFRPLLADNLTTKPADSFLQNPIEKLSNMTNEARGQVVPVVEQFKDRVLNVFGVDRNASSTTTLSNQQPLGDANNKVNQPPTDPNVPAPPLANYAQRRQQPDHVESAQGPPQAPYENNRLANNDENQQRFQRSLNGTVSDHGNAKVPNDQEENDDEENADDVRNNQPNLAAPPSNFAKDNQFGNDNQPIVPAVPSRLNNENNYRIADRDQFRHVRNGARRARQAENGEGIVERNNEAEQQEPRRNYV